MDHWTSPEDKDTATTTPACDGIKTVVVAVEDPKKKHKSTNKKQNYTQTLFLGLFGGLITQLITYLQQYANSEKERKKLPNFTSIFRVGNGRRHVD